MSNALSELEIEFCPPLDPTLVYAIYHDFEGTDAERLQQSRIILESLKLDALAEQTLDFDPSGSGGGRARNADISSDIGDTSTESGLTVISHGLSSLDTGERASNAGSSLEGSPEYEKSEFLNDMDALSPETKVALLAETFPTLKLPAIRFTLGKCHDDFERATDELLNQVYFDGAQGEEHISNRSVDAFFANDGPSRSKKKKARKNRWTDHSFNSAENSPISPTGTTNKWETSSRDIGFISSRMNVPTTTVKSIYHKSGFSLSKTIETFLELEMQANDLDDNPDPLQLKNAVELSDEFPLVDLPAALALVRLTHPSTAAAHELAKALHKPPSPVSGGIQIIQKFAPIDTSDHSTPPLSPLPRASNQNASSLRSARATAFEQASSAYRKGKSDPLMKAAAGYYGQVGRDYDAAYKSATSAAADALVAAQSSPSTLDLHGVSVKDATRITRERVTSWWHSLGDSIYGRGERPGVGSGYKIITGKGTHSVAGRAKIGPAVAKMLVREGWKVEVGEGVLVVTGVAKRR